MSKQVAVNIVSVGPDPPIVLIKKIVLRIVDDRPALLRNQTPFAMKGLSVHKNISVLGAVQRNNAELIERLDGSKQIAGVGLSVVPRLERSRPNRRDGQCRRTELMSNSVLKLDLGRGDGQNAYTRTKRSFDEDHNSFPNIQHANLRSCST